MFDLRSLGPTLKPKNNFFFLKYSFPALVTAIKSRNRLDPKCISRPPWLHVVMISSTATPGSHGATMRRPKSNRTAASAVWPADAVSANNWLAID